MTGTSRIAAASSPPESMNGKGDSARGCQSGGNTATSRPAPPDHARNEYALIPPDPERGGCLSLWLVGVMGFNLVGIFLFLAEGTLDCIGLGLSLANILYASALWRMKRFGVYGLAGSFGLTVILGVVSQSLYVVASGIVPMIILFALVHRLWDDLEPLDVLG